MSTAPVLSQLQTFLGVTNRRQTVIASNMANVNTPGYSRQVVNLSAAALAQNGTVVDSGVTFGGYTSVRDQLLNIQINAKTAQQASLTSQSASLSSLNTAFSGTTTGIGASLSSFFSNISALSTNPSDTSARQAALSSAAQLANAFRQGSSDLASAQTAAGTTIASTVAQINSLTAQIASLNGQLSSIQASGGEGGSLEDQRDGLTTQLSALTGVSVIQSNDKSGNNQPTITTGNGVPLVIGDHALTLQVSTSSSGLSQVLDSSGNDITDTLTTGTLGGALTTQDVTVPHLLDQLDSLATQFASAINAAQAAGYDAAGASGQPMFTVSGTHPAASIALALSSVSGIAASSDGATGSSGNLANLLAVQTSTLPSGYKPIDAYANLVSSIGSSASGISTSLSATSLSLQQLQTQQSSTSGVSTDEESANLIRYQQAYTAAAHVISTVNDLFSVVMNMGSGS